MGHKNQTVTSNKEKKQIMKIKKSKDLAKEKRTKVNKF